MFPLPAQRPFLCLLWPLGEELSWLKRGAWCEDIRSAYGPANQMSNTGDAFVHVWASHCTSWQDNDCWLASKLTSPLAWSACTRHISFCDWVLIYKDFHSLPCSNYLSIKNLLISIFLFYTLSPSSLKYIKTSGQNLFLQTTAKTNLTADALWIFSLSLFQISIFFILASTHPIPTQHTESRS